MANEKAQEKTVMGMESLMSNAKKVLLTGDMIKDFTCIDLGGLCIDSCIQSVEYNEFLLCLGMDFYEHLKNCIKDKPKSALCYDDDTPYVVGDIFVYEGHYYETVQDGQSISPLNTTYYTPITLFDSVCLNVLFCNFMGEYIAWSVMIDALPLIRTKLGAKGLHQINTSSKITADIKDYRIAQKSLMKNRQRAFENMDNFITRVTKVDDYNGCYDLYKPLGIGCCCECGCVSCGCDDDDCFDSNDEHYQTFEYG